MKNFFVILSSVFLLSYVTLSTALPASAHELESDNGVNAILHINPDDNPVVGKQIGIYFLFARSDGAFSINNYDLSLSLKSATGAVTKYQINPAYFGAASKGSATVDFPTADVYDLIVTGTATDPAAKSFKLDYPVRVAGGTAAVSAKTADPSIVLITGATVSIVFVMIAVSNVRRGGRYAATKASK